ncbi:MAG TPA: hypothetical protein DG761_12625 [Gammaproteobacteria bacterium]|nr:hypothetical protein [Gammaproteobacteria bacterium]
MESITSSFRDPCGFIFKHENFIYRQVNRAGAGDFDRFIDSGLYQVLIDKGYLLEHEDVTDTDIPRSDVCHRILRPLQLKYISYPYEWCFSQLQDAAMLTLRVQTIALKLGFSLKDASAYNVQFVDGKPVFIDTLSFAFYQEGQPWAAYRQFCQHFLAPLALMAHVDINLGKLLVTHIDGIPLDLASKLLPQRTRLSMGLQTHVHLHAKLQSSYSDIASEAPARKKSKAGASSKKISKSGLQGIVESLATAVRKLQLSASDTQWANYYNETNYTDDATASKRDLVAKFLAEVEGPLTIIHDLGANTGEFSRIAAEHAELVVSQDIDPVAVERNYLQVRSGSCASNILPLLQDLGAPAPAIGWANAERDSLIQRAQCDLIMALALVHHLAIGNNVPLEQIASFFSQIGKRLIIEFVPKTDSQVIRMLTTREDIFNDYDQAGFESAFSKYFMVERRESIAGSERHLYLMKRNGQLEPEHSLEFRSS